MAIFEAGDDFTEFFSFRIPFLMSALSPKAAFELIDDQIQDIRGIVFCLERMQPWMLEKFNNTTSYLDSTITTRMCILIDRLMEHTTLVLGQPLFSKVGNDVGKLWPSLGILPDEESRYILKFAGMLITNRQSRWDHFRESLRPFSELDKIQTTSPTPIYAKLATLFPKIASHFVSGLHPLLLMIGATCARMLLSSDGLTSDDELSFIQAHISFMHIDSD
jgi:hypothetical protein